MPESHWRGADADSRGDLRASSLVHGWQRKGVSTLASRCLIDIYLTIRVSALGFSWLLPLVGMAGVTGKWPAAATTWLLLAALAFHVFAYVFNDVVDRDIDASEPLRADSPLLRGVMTRRQAMGLAWAQLPLSFGALLAAGGGGAALLSLTLALVGMTLYNIYGKRCRWPLLTDAVQSLGWCALLATGAFVVAEAGAPGAASGWLGAYVFCCVMLVNGVHGSLRDLANDARRGARTTALWFGAHAEPGGDGAAQWSTSLMRYAITLQAALVISACGAWAAMPYASGREATVALALLLPTLAAACLSLAQGLAAGAVRQQQMSHGARHIVATLLVLPALVLPRLGVGEAAVLLLAFGLPVLAMWAYNGSHWRLPAAAAGTSVPPAREPPPGLSR